jgi:hypothetical protein
VYLDEEGARKRADDLVVRAREYAGGARVVEAQAAVREALLLLPGHAPAARLSHELAEAARFLMVRHVEAPAPVPVRARGGARCPRSPRSSRAPKRSP